MEVHRIRFFQYMPSAIQCIAFDDGSSPPRLALGRENGNVEVWQHEHSWTRTLVLRSSKDECAESILWYQGRLLSAGLSGVLVQWSLSRLCPEMEVNTYGGAAWDMARRPEVEELAVACEDGCVRFFDVEAGAIVFKKSYSNQGGGRCLAVAFHPSGNLMLSGGADSIIRVWNLTTGVTTHRITLDQPRQQAVLVWTLAFLRDMTIVSGDSDGRVQFWDAHHGAMIQSFQAHRGDVLSLVANKNQDTVFASGVDCKVVKFHCIAAEADRKKWINVGAVRQHSHDVRSLALLEDDGADVLVSGGLDTQLGVYAAGSFNDKTSRLFSSYPTTSPVTICRREPVVSCQFDSHVDMWTLGSARDGTDVSAADTGTVLPLLQQPRHVLRINTKKQHSIVCSAVSPCGKWLAVSDRAGTRVFSIATSTQDEKTQYMVTSLSETSDLNAAQCLAFLPESNRLLIASNYGLQAATLSDSSVSSSHSVYQTDKSDCACINLTVSASGHSAALAFSDCRVDIVDLKKDKLKRSTPRLSSPCSALVFLTASSSSSTTLAIVTRAYQLFTYNFVDNLLEDISIHLKPISNARRSLGPIISCLQLTDSRLLMCSNALMAVLDFSKTPCQFKDSLIKPKKRKSRGGRHEDENGIHDDEADDSATAAHADRPLTIVTQYQDILACGLHSASQLVLVERPWTEVMQKFPDALHRVRYGAT